MISSPRVRKIISPNLGCLPMVNPKTRALNMRQKLAVFIAVGLSAWSAQGAIVQFSLGGTTVGTTVVSGSFSYDTAVVLPGSDSENAIDSLLTFTVTFSSIPGAGPTSTTFSKGVNASTNFKLRLDDSGSIIDLGPQFAANADNYRLSPWSPNTASLFHPANGVFATDDITFNYTQVPELSHTALGVGLGLLGFVGFRAWRQRR